MKFSIRELMLVTVIVAILAAWWLDHRRQAIANEQLVKELDKLPDTFIGYPSEARWKEIFADNEPDDIVPNTSAPVPNPAKK